MNIFILAITSLRALRKHKIRSFLTILGIMIGISAIIITFSIGRGAEEAVASQIMSMGENAVYVVPSTFIKHGALKGSGTSSTRLRLRDILAIKNQSPEIQAISPMHMTVQTIEYQGSTAHQNVVGCYPNMPTIDNNKLQKGIYFNEFHLKNRSNVIILGSKPAEELFKGANPIGKIILVNSSPCKVIGVLEKKPHFFGPRDPNEQAFIPYSTSKKICAIEGEADDQLHSIALRLYKGVDSIPMRRKILNILRFSHNLNKNEESPYVIFDTQTLAQVARDAAAIIRLFGLFAASISLLVGSIGVMNIMLVSVKERTKEIGLRMAIGATRKLIQMQFLFESTVLCFIGGIIGVAIGFIGQYAIGKGTTLSPVLEFGPLFISLFVTALIGIFFGYYPARQASLLNPVDALLDR
ncbi:ABC transporter permease [bacterium]|nr:ABC transporter permease [bacterium]